MPFGNPAGYAKQPMQRPVSAPKPGAEQAGATIPGTGYPSAADIPELNQQPMDDKLTESNPVLQAFQTLAAFANVAEEQQKPFAGQLKQALASVAEAIAGGGAQPAGPEADMMANAAPPELGNEPSFNPFEPPEETMRPKKKTPPLDQSRRPLI